MIYALSAFTLLAAFVVYSSWRKKRQPLKQPLLHSSGIVDSPLNPSGSILVDGELYVAQAADGGFVPAKTKVVVVSVRGHLLLVEKD